MQRAAEGDGPDLSAAAGPPLVLPVGFATERAYAEWLRTELERLIERSYERIFFARPFKNFEFVFGPWAHQGRLFAIDLFNALKGELLEVPAGSHLTLLDVGSGNGAGKALLASLFSHPSVGFTIECEALEPDRIWEELYPVLYGNVTLRSDSLWDVPDESYDIVTASHVIEHIARAEVAPFIRKLVAIARRLTVITCPWQEQRPLCAAHAFSVDDDLLREVEPDSFTVFRSLGWHGATAGASDGQCVALVFRKNNANSPGVGG